MKRYCVVLFFVALSIAHFIDLAVAAEPGKTPTPPSNLTITSEPVPPPPTPGPPPGNDSLLSGQTPSNFRPPSGWTLVRTQDFESGSLGPNEWFTSDTGITSSRVHSGSKSAGGRYMTDGADVRWGVAGSQVGSYNDIYISFWEFSESQARFNTEFFMGFLEKKFNDGSYQNFIFNHFHNVNGEFNATSSLLIFQGEGTVAGAETYAVWGPNHTIPRGYWIQRELWYHPNTLGNRDGFARMYENGVLTHSVTNADLNGNLNMGSANVHVGGVYTKHVWRHEDGSCSNFEGDGTGYDRETNWDNCKCPNQCPPNGTVPMFYRYFDDIIIMKR